MGYSRQAVVDLARSWIGKKEADGSYKTIIDIYNSYSGAFPRGTKMLYSWAWCACTWSALAIKLGYTAIMPIEISCYYLIERAKAMGIWVENDAYIPKPGDAVLYDWSDGSNYASYDNTGAPDHVGTVETVNASAGTFTVIEGNMSDAVGRRTMKINGRYIRGFICPKYTEDGTQTSTGSSIANKTVDELAKEVLAGVYGNGDDRKNALGARYSEVQARVNEILNGSTKTEETSLTRKETATANAKAIWDYLIGKIGNAYGVAGLMGNLFAESALVPINLQNSYEKSLGYTDASYTAAVDNGSYTNFVRDSAGYGLAQWTYWSRKEALLKYAQEIKSSVGNLTTQLEFLYKELSESYTGVLSALKNATSVRAASDVVLTQFERPANQGESVQKTRASYGQTYFDKYAGSGATSKTEEPKTETKTETPKTYKVDYAASQESGHSKGTSLRTTADLNLRTGAGTNKTVIKVLGKGTRVTWYGFYTTVSGVKWYLVAVDGITGFCSSRYLA